jgi:DNA repair protein SbcC/Rad50
MIIRSVRLKNIKSYGAGDADDGVTVEFEPGVNRIAGRNGHGKSTLIEAIGYALFLATPDFAENFAVDTYLLRNGTKTGEIDVTFEHHSAAHRVERGIGKASKRRTKVIDLADGSICAEGDKEVEDFLCRLLGVPSGKTLIEVFTKLVGVKQGRLTRPFDSKAAEARRFFEPLFDVAIFKQCHDKLKPARDQFNVRLGVTRERKAGVDQKIADRADSVEKLAAAAETIRHQQGDSETAGKARDAAKANKDKHEQFKQARAEAEKRCDSVKNELYLADNQLTTAKQRLTESEGAVAIAKETLPAHENHGDATRQLTALEAQRVERDALKWRRDAAESERKEYKSRADAARAQAGAYSKQQKVKSAGLEKMGRELATLDTRLSNSELDFKNTEKAFAEADELRSELQVWISSLGGTTRRIREAADEISRLHQDLLAWKPEALKAAEEANTQASAKLKANSNKLAEARERHATLKAQLDQIAGGVCPFLKESCRQFDEAKVQADLSTLIQEIENGEQLLADCEKIAKEATQALDVLKEQSAQLKPKQAALESESRELLQELQALLPKNISAAAGKLRAWEDHIEILPASPVVADVIKPEDASRVAEAAAGFVGETGDWWDRVEQLFGEREEQQQKTRQDRVRDEQTLKHLRKQNADVTSEAERLAAEAEATQKEAEKLDANAAESQKKLGECDDNLKVYASLDNTLKAQRERLETHQEGHEKYLQAKELAGALKDRQATVASADSKRAETDVRLKAEAQKLAEADKVFDPEALSSAIEDYETKSNMVATMREKLKHAQQAKGKEEKRFQEWETAVEELSAIERELSRLEASIEITDLARKVLQNAAPTVAQHLCDRIAGRTQIVFNQINPDPIELSWDARQYSVRIVPGDRRFAMLSGGEQTKLALALTLAMIEEFGGLRFCIFDEPTYGVDADSRRKLADAIIAAQSAANLEQLLLVSHDDAFEDKIEHAILLNKTAQAGSLVSEQG